MPMRFAVRWCLFLVVACAATAQSERTLRVLFLGNSLTAGNDVPGIVQALAQLHGVTLVADVNAPGGFSLEDHWNTGHGDLVRQGSYDLVVLQQGPSTLPESQTNLQQWTQVWTQHARSQATEAALFMVWPFQWQANGFDLVSLSYRNAAERAGIEVFAAGETWEAALARQPGLSLHSDDLHANAAGSLLAAMTIGRRLFALDPARVPARLVTRTGTIAISAATLENFRVVVAAIPAASLATQPAPPPSPGGPPITLPTPTGATPQTGRGGGGAVGAVVAALLAACLLLRAARRHAR